MVHPDYYSHFSKYLHVASYILSVSSIAIILPPSFTCAEWHLLSDPCNYATAERGNLDGAKLERVRPKSLALTMRTAGFARSILPFCELAPMMVEFVKRRREQTIGVIQTMPLTGRLGVTVEQVCLYKIGIRLSCINESQGAWLSWKSAGLILLPYDSVANRKYPEVVSSSLTVPIYFCFDLHFCHIPNQQNKQVSCTGDEGRLRGCLLHYYLGHSAMVAASSRGRQGGTLMYKHLPSFQRFACLFAYC